MKKDRLIQEMEERRRKRRVEEGKRKRLREGGGRGEEEFEGGRRKSKRGREESGLQLPVVWVREEVGVVILCLVEKLFQFLDKALL